MKTKILKYYIVIFFIFSLGSCALMQKIFMKKDPEFVVQSVSVQKVSLDGIVFKIESELFNYYSFGLPESILAYNVNINQIKFFDGQTNKFSVKANSSVKIPLTINLRFEDIAKLVSEFYKTDKLLLSVQGKSVFPLNYPGLPKSISVPFSVEKTIPAFLPKIQIQDVSIKLTNYELDKFFLGKSSLNLNLKLIVENTGGSFFKLNQKNFVFQLQGSDIVKTEFLNFSESRKQEIEIKSEIPITNTMQSLYKAVLQKQIDFYLKTDFEFIFENVDFKQFQLPVEYRGEATTLQ